MKQVAVTKGWPAMNSSQFWSLTERVSDLFTLEKSDSTSATYIFMNCKHGNILCAPFQALYNLNVDWPITNVNDQQRLSSEVRAALFYNNTCLETCTEEDGEIEFNTFGEEDALPLCLMKETDELRLVISFQQQTASIPLSIGSARILRFTPKEHVDPFCICTTETCALMYDGSKIQAFSSLNNEYDENENSTNEYTDIVEAIMNSQMPSQDINELLHSMEKPVELNKLKKTLAKK